LEGAGWSLRHFLDKVKECTLIAPQMKSFGQKKISNQKVPFWQFFRQGWDGRALLARPSRIPHRIGRR